MIGAVEAAGPDAPQSGGKDDDGQEEENAGDFKPENSAYTAEGLQETAYAAGDAPGDLTGRLPFGAALRDGFSGWLLRRRVGCSSRTGSDSLAGNASGDAKTDAEGAADGFRFHSVYDGSSGGCRTAFSPFVAVSQLLPDGDRSKVEKSYAATRAVTACAGRRSWRYP